MPKKNLYIDFDGVILDTMTQLKKDLQNQNLTKQEDIIKFYQTYPFEKIVQDQNILNDSINNIKRIITSNKFNLSILTHVNSLKEAEIKINYLRKYFNDITIIPCPKNIPKTKMIYTKNAILIDDYTENLKQWEKEKGIPIKFSQKELKIQYPTIKQLDEIIDLL